MKKLIVLIVAALLSAGAFAHAGGRNAGKCHTDHSDGTYHCH
jgi:hypothetical protein